MGKRGKNRKDTPPKIWLWLPELYWYGPKCLIPVFLGGDEFNRHTIVLGWPITGYIIIAYRKCPGLPKCDCLEAENEENLPYDR